MLRQEGRTSGQGAFDGTGTLDESEPGRIDVAAAGDVDSVTPGVGARLVVSRADVKVVGGASVHCLQTVIVEVTTVSVMVIAVVMIVLEPEVLVIVIGNEVVVVYTSSFVRIPEPAGIAVEVSTVTAELAGDVESLADDSKGNDDPGIDDGCATVEPGRTDVGVDGAGNVSVLVSG